MFLQEDLARARHEHELRDSEQLIRVRRLVAPVGPAAAPSALLA